VRRQADPNGRSLAHLTHRAIADLEATGMALRRGTTARRNRTGGHPPFARRLGTQVVKISGQAAARTGLRRHKVAAAQFDPVTAESAADVRKAYYPGSRRIMMRGTGDRRTGRLPRTQLFGHQHAEIAKRIGMVASAICGTVTANAVSDLHLPYTPPGQPQGGDPDGKRRPGSGLPSSTNPLWK
jgi:NADPH-dependent 2,4-dienoyl-CoA reductase/sulfur reductase-like enzyme